jgi:hypothetical protein
VAEKHTIRDSKGTEHTVIVERDRRLKKSARWQREPDGTILLRVPYRIPRSQIEPLLTDVAKSLDRQTRRRRTPRTDDDLQERAEYVNKTFFAGAIQWTAIRWVSNMERRLGSCTNGGPTDGHIRISERIREWPQYVIDYVIAHELAHRIHQNHSDSFWSFLKQAYPLTERARGFVQGNRYALGESMDEEQD